MICVKCVAGGTANAVGDHGTAHLLHANCEYSNCTCQHKTGEHWIKVEKR